MFFLTKPQRFIFLLWQHREAILILFAFFLFQVVLSYDESAWRPGEMSESECLGSWSYMMTYCIMKEEKNERERKKKTNQWFSPQIFLPHCNLLLPVTKNYKLQTSKYRWFKFNSKWGPMVMETLEKYENFLIVQSRPGKWKFIKSHGNS